MLRASLVAKDAYREQFDALGPPEGLGLGAEGEVEAGVADVVL